MQHDVRSRWPTANRAAYPRERLHSRDTSNAERAKCVSPSRSITASTRRRAAGCGRYRPSGMCGRSACSTRLPRKTTAAARAACCRSAVMRCFVGTVRRGVPIFTNVTGMSSVAVIARNRLPDIVRGENGSPKPLSCSPMTSKNAASAMATPPSHAFKTCHQPLWYLGAGSRSGGEGRKRGVSPRAVRCESRRRVPSARS